MLSALIISIESISRGEAFYFGAVRQYTTFIDTSTRIYMGEEGKTSYLGGIAGVPSRNNYVRHIDELWFYSELAGYSSVVYLARAEGREERRSPLKALGLVLQHSREAIASR
jgi:hypothetical protein